MRTNRPAWANRVMATGYAVCLTILTVAVLSPLNATRAELAYDMAFVTMLWTMYHQARRVLDGEAA